jgi:hypothetical protein
MRTIFLILSISVIAFAALASFIYWGASWSAPTTKASALFELESDLTFSNLKPQASPISSVPKGANVDVLFDTYGKDYWACYVRTETKQRGWMLCTDLQR